MVEGLSEAGKNEILSVYAALQRSRDIEKVISELTTTKGFEAVQSGLDRLFGGSTSVRDLRGKHGRVSFIYSPTGDGNVGSVSYHAANGLQFGLFDSFGGLVKSEKLGQELDAVMSTTDNAKAGQEAEAKARKETEARARKEAADKAKQQAEAQARREAESKADREAAEALKKPSLFGRIGSLFSRKDKG
jgi:hypothetical protein